MKYNITLDSFEGPFDLLYHLIEKSEVDIYDISIAEIAEQYMEYLSKMKELDLDITSEFILMAATLLEIKSKMLLPKNEYSEEQIEMEGADPREELIERLITYRKYKSAALDFKSRFDKYGKVFYKPREEIDIDGDENIVISNIKLKDLVKAFDNIIKNNKVENNEIDFHEVKREEMSIEQAMNFVEKRLENSDSIKFNKLFESTITRSNIVSIFVSVLELLKLKKVTIVQDNNFTDISIRKKSKVIK
ncbi:MAG: segregation and condensation protein A [Senegalia sp. (in: firmicutes)]|uniref:segregation and condensation protein A n=1 Tax=Senegalia sp. (in: firmicutes) TaxID=1924098 RepID=UPI003F98E5DB